MLTSRGPMHTSNTPQTFPALAHGRCLNVETKLSLSLGTENRINAVLNVYSLFLHLRPIYTEELPGVAAYDSMFVSLRPGFCHTRVAVPSAELPDATKQTKNRARLLLATSQCRLAFSAIVHARELDFCFPFSRDYRALPRPL